MENLKFRRQFLLTAKECVQLQNWQKEIFGSHILYVHNDSEVSIVNKGDKHFIIIGYVINPKIPEKTTLCILTDIANLPSVNSIPEYLYCLVGRFVLIIKDQKKFIFYNDACGLKTVYYTNYKNNIYAASQPLLLQLVVPIKKSVNYQQYFDSDYTKYNIEHWIPAGSTLYEEVYHLTPNHYFDSSSFKQVRYYPNKTIKHKKTEVAIKEFSSLLKKTMIAANTRFNLAVSITAGLDSRIVLSACKEIAEDIYFYTLQYRNLTKSSNDIKIPYDLLSKLGFQHHLIDCRKTMNNDFENLYINNTDIYHLNDWGIIANGMYDNYPVERIAVKGNCSEIGRCYFYPTGKHKKISSYNDFIILETGWENMPFIKNRISEWYDNIKDDNINFGYDLFDLFYWEHRIGSWQAQSQLEWDIIQDTFTPFNNRELLDIMLSIDVKYRHNPNYIFFKKSIKLLWENVLKEPINPNAYTIKAIVRRLVMKILR
jgi:hypothetical protein